MEDFIKAVELKNIEVPEDFWGLGESNLLKMEDFIEELLKGEDTHE